ncbi:MAG TPA: ribosome silencing factor [Mycobacteriales bacterium]|nr:ribosome silencing factor [Mycobacteriales bacterium]
MSASARSIKLAEAAVSAAADKLATDLAIIDVSEQLVITDCFVLAAAPNERQVRSVVDAIEERLLPMKAKPARREGQEEGRWVLLDFLDIVVHVQHAEERTYYALERLWKDCPTLPLPADALPPADAMRAPADSKQSPAS